MQHVRLPRWKSPERERRVDPDRPLPQQWTPNQTYNLTVVLSRTGSVKYGFQLSAVDSGGRQAGTFTAGNARVSVITATLGGNPLQFAQHNQIATSLAPFTGSFSVTWRAPSNASVGAVRLNVAGSAVNGDASVTGDFIYAFERMVNPVVLTDNSIRSYCIPNLGGTSFVTDGLGSLAVGYARIQPDSGNTTPSGIAIFGLRQNNVLVTEAAVPYSRNQKERIVIV